MFYKNVELWLKILLYFHLINFLISIEIVWFQIHQQNERQIILDDCYSLSLINNRIKKKRII